MQVQRTSAGRPNVIGQASPANGGPTLLFLGHSDTVGVEGVKDPFGARLEGGRLHGRGAYDMKSGLAAAMCAAAETADLDLGVVIAAVCDEEAGGTGTRALLELIDPPDAAIVVEPTDLNVAIAHKGFVGFEIETSGVAAHGSRPDLGVDAILAMGPLIAGLEDLGHELQQGEAHPLLGSASLHASLIEGGQEASSYPARCLLTGECRTLPGRGSEAGLEEVVRRSSVNAELRITHRGDPFETREDADVVQVVRRHSGGEIVGLGFWADSARLGARRIPTVLFGPKGGGAHAATEWVDLESVHRVRDVLVRTAQDICQMGGLLPTSAA